MLIVNPMISVLHNIMWSIGKKNSHEAKGKNSASILALVGQDVKAYAVGAKLRRLRSTGNCP